MNHPMRDPLDEIRAIAGLGFDFVDLTLEPALARADRVDPGAIRGALADTGLGVIGHTAWYLPIASPFNSLRRAAWDEFARCLDVFAAVGVRLVNLHPDLRAPLHDEEWLIAANVEAVGALAAMARDRDLRLMLENLPGPFNRVDVLRRLLDAIPDLGLHLDVGHANLRTPRILTAELLAAFHTRLAHVHFSDNRGGDDDLHLPLGAGRIDWPETIRLLIGHGYAGTITLEVFSPDSDYLALSREKVLRLWTQAATAAMPHRTLSGQPAPPRE